MEATTFFTLSFLFLSFAPKLGESVRPSRGILPSAVVDTSGHELRKGQYYYLLAWPNIIGTVSTISPLVQRNGTCWVQYKVQLVSNSTAGIPVKFSPVLADEDDIIRESTFLNINFLEPTVSHVCGDSLWRVINRPDPVFGQQFVVVGTKSGFTRPVWYKIERNSKHPRRDYKLLLCYVYVSDSLQHSLDDDCHIVGIFADDKSSGRLSLDNTTIKFAFRHILEPQSDQHIKMSVS